MRSFLLTITSMLLLSFIISCSAFAGSKAYIKQTSTYPNKLTSYIDYELPVQLFYVGEHDMYVAYNSQRIASPHININQGKLTISFTSEENKTEYYTSQIFELNLPQKIDFIDVLIDGTLTPTAITIIN